MSWSAEVWASLVCRADEAERLQKVLKAPAIAESSRAAARWEQFGKLPSTARQVLGVIASLEREAEGYAWPSMRKLGVETERALDTVVRQVAELRRRGLIEVRLAPEQMNAGNRMRGHCYRVSVPPVLRAADKAWSKAADSQRWSRLDKLPQPGRGAGDYDPGGFAPFYPSRTDDRYGAVPMSSTGPYRQAERAVR